jgi:energy-coupling factor transporter ATP-binding protein EcfA2
MNINNLKINNFRSISQLHLNLEAENRVICFVGENGSAKTSVLSLITEAIVSQSNIKFPNFNKMDGKRYRLISDNEIKNDSEFYSFDINYSNIQNRAYNYKKLVGNKANIPKNVYSDTIKGIALNSRLYYSELSTVANLNTKDDFLSHNVFLVRPGQRHERYNMDINNKEASAAKLSVESGYADSVPYPFVVEHSGDDIQTILLDMFFDAQVGYQESRIGFDSIVQILKKITEKDFGNLQITQSPYREVVSSNVGMLKSFSQGELDLIVTIASIVQQQLFFYRFYTEVEREQHEVTDIWKVPGIVIIDEVDLHLHPKAQEKYLKILTEQFTNIQFIVTTHSPFVVRGLPKHSKVINLPSGRVFEENFEAMDIDSITNIIFGYEGGFSETVNEKFNKFKDHLVSEIPNIEILRKLFNELSSSNSAKEELELYLASYADEELIKSIKGAKNEQSR